MSLDISYVDSLSDAMAAFEEQVGREEAYKFGMLSLEEAEKNTRSWTPTFLRFGSKLDDSLKNGEHSGE